MHLQVDRSSLRRQRRTLTDCERDDEEEQGGDDSGEAEPRDVGDVVELAERGEGVERDC